MNADEARTYRTELHLRDVQAVGAAGPFRYLEGRAVPYGTWADIGWFVEQHAQDGFKRSTAAGTGKGLPLLLFHDNRSFPVGHAETWSHDDGGLDGVWRLNGSEEAQRAAEAANAGDLHGLSVGFMPIRSEWDYVDDWDLDLGPDHKDHVTRVESRLLEVSLTPTPAFAEAEVASVRTAYNVQTRNGHRAADRSVDTWRRELERLRSGPS